jgi:transposase-like protein
MSQGNRFTEEFRLEAVKQVVDRGFGVADISKR